ncbi:MAG: C1 family peptidase [Muribaculaceae bacterium]|nr:C1 family peptidase [Muribaculaceae bacterium]
MKHSLILTLAMAAAITCQAKNDGGLSAETLQQLRESYGNTPADRAIHNAIAGGDINKLAYNLDNLNNFDNHFSHRVPSKGITNQRSSGRCWLFTGLNVLRSQAMRQHSLPKLELSQSYNFFYDQLEKSNLFLQGIIDTSSKPMDDRMVEWLFDNTLGDGGQFTGVADNLTKYGVVPKELMNETHSTENTKLMRQFLTWKLREDALELRKLCAEGKKAGDVLKRKNEMLAEVYRILALNIGVPPTQFTWTRRDSKGNAIETKTYTPQQFYQEYFGNDLKNGYVMFMNDPTREYYKVYEIDFDRHSYDGDNWKYINVPMDEIKKMAIESIKDSTAMYFSCDVGKYADRERGILDINNYDYESLLGVKFGMDKKQRIETGVSGSTHAMTLAGVDLDENGTPKKWLIENSWGTNPNDGYMIATDKWMDEFLFRLVVEKRFVPENLLKLLEQKPIMLPAWDPMY